VLCGQQKYTINRLYWKYDFVVLVEVRIRR